MDVRPRAERQSEHWEKFALTQLPGGRKFCAGVEERRTGVPACFLRAPGVPVTVPPFQGLQAAHAVASCCLRRASRSIAVYWSWSCADRGGCSRVVLDVFAGWPDAETGSQLTNASRLFGDHCTAVIYGHNTLCSHAYILSGKCSVCLLAHPHF